MMIENGHGFLVSDKWYIGICTSNGYLNFFLPQVTKWSGLKNDLVVGICLHFLKLDVF